MPSSSSTSRPPGPTDRDQRAKLSCQLYQRSADIFLGVPFNIASYALLTLMLAQVCGYQAGDFVHTFGDAHLYSNHLEQAQLQLTRATRALPTMRLNPDIDDLFAFRFQDFSLEGYDPHPHIAAPSPSNPMHRRDCSCCCLPSATIAAGSRCQGRFRRSWK
jgi:hypothetical protein